MPNTTRAGLPYPPATGVPPNVPADLQALAEALDERVPPSPRPFINCLLRRSDGSNVLNPNDWTDLKVYPVTGQIAGAWDANYGGSGLASTAKGWYLVDGKLSTASTAGRFESMDTRAVSSEMPFTVGVPAYSGAGFGFAGGASPMYCPNGLQLLLRAYTSSVNYGGSATQPVSLRLAADNTTPLSSLRVVYLGP